MYHELQPVTLRTGETVTAAVIHAPDAAWAARLERMLQHKGEPWVWQNCQLLREPTPVEARFFVLHREGVPFSNIMRVEAAGVALLGHVWTEPAGRGAGARAWLMERVMADFHSRGGRAVFLSTDFDTPPWHYYRRRGFSPIEDGSGYMAWYAASAAAFETEWFSATSAVVEPLDWQHWPVAAPLFVGAAGGIARLTNSPLFGRSSSEGPLLALLHRHACLRALGKPARISVLRDAQSAAVLGLASRLPDPIWPDVELLDVFCHPRWWHRAPELMAAVDRPGRTRTVAYCDTLQPQKRALLEPAGFREVARLPEWLRTAPQDPARLDVALLLQD